MNCPPGMTHRNIPALCQRSRDISLEKGWLNEDGSDPRTPATVFLLFVSEISEALEDYRNNKPATEIYYEVKVKEADGTVSKQNNVLPAALAELKKLESKYGRGRDFLDAKPCGIPIELADFVIRICQRCGSAGADESDSLARAFDASMAEGVETSEFDVLLAEAVVACADHYREASSPYPSGSPEEPVGYLGQALALTFAFAEKNDIDLWAAIDEKEAYNRTRPIKHGGKKV